jgi:large subunit ribosomal protein L9
MKVVLQEDVKKLGKKGDIVDVSDGYARNYLIPRGLAVEGSKGNIQVAKEKNLLKQKRDAREEEQARELADRLRNVVVKIPVKAGDKGRLFGSITSKDIAEALRKQRIDIDRRKIELTGAIKSLGKYEVGVKLHSGVSAVVNVSVVDAGVEGDE